MFAVATLAAGCGGGGATIGSGPAPVAVSTASPSSSSAPGQTASPTPTTTAVVTLAPGQTPSPTPTATAVVTLAPGQTPSPTPSLTPTPRPSVTGSPTGAPASTPSPIATTTVAPGQTPSPTPPPAAAIYHPGNNGSTFAMNGTLVVTYDRSNQYPTPEPISTSAYGVAQSIAVTNPASFNGTSGADFRISETDNQTAPASQTFSDTLDDYFKYTNTMYAGNFLNLGYSSIDDSGYQVTVTNGNNDQLADILPEVSGASWSNMAGRTISTNDGNGQTSSQTYADDGSYNETVTYQNYMPSPNPTGSQLTNTATLVSKIDGSANYNTPRLGTNRKYNYVYSLGAPSAAGSGTITETTTIPPAAGSTAAPTTSTTAIPNWMPATVPGSLASETDIDNGPKPVPTTCLAPSAYTSNPNQIVQVKKRVDPLAGELETTTTTTYVTANVGPVCVVLHDVQVNYYDFSGQNGVGYFSGTPQQTTTIDEVLYLSTEALQSIARHPELRSAVARSFNATAVQGRVSMLRNISRSRMFGAVGRGRSYRTSTRSFVGVLK